MSEHQTRITTDLGQTLRALDSVARRMEAIEHATRKANSAAKDHQTTLSKGLKGGGQAFSKMGGPAGAFGGQVAGAAGLGGGFAVAGIAAAGVGVAYKLLTAVIEDRTQAEADLLKRTGSYRQALDAAGKSLDQQALAGLAQEDPIRKLVKRGGSLADAQKLAVDMNISDADAANGLAELQTEFGALKRGMLEAAKLATESGQMSFPDAVASLQKDRFAGRLAGDGRAPEAAARIVGEKIGDKRFTTSQLDQYRANTSPLIESFDENGSLDRDMGRIELAGVASGRAAKVKRRRLAEASDPEAAELTAVAKAAQQTAKDLTEAARGARVLGTGMADALDEFKEAFRDWFKFGGSATGDIERGLGRDTKAKGKALSERERG